MASKIALRGPKKAEGGPSAEDMKRRRSRAGGILVDAVASALLKSPPSVVVYGDTTSVPRYDLIAKALA